MGKVGLVFDTSALISLDSVNCLELLKDCVEFLITSEVKNELVGLSKSEKNVESFLKEIEFKESFVSIPEKYKNAYKWLGKGEISSLVLAQNENKEIVIDDVEALEIILRIFKVRIKFSVHLIYFLVLKGKLTPKEGLDKIERLRKIRSWESNVIYRAARNIWRKEFRI